MLLVSSLALCLCCTAIITQFFIPLKLLIPGSFDLFFSAISTHLNYRLVSYVQFKILSSKSNNLPGAMLSCELDHGVFLLLL